MASVATETGIARFKLVDEAFAPAKARAFSAAYGDCGDFAPQWEAYARLERGWDESTLRDAAAAGLRKLYFGLEQVSTASRDVFGKGDHPHPDEMLRLCVENGIAVHMFCMVGHPRTTRDDAWKTVEFLIENAPQIETADLVGFRLDRGTSVSGVRRRIDDVSDWQLSLPFEPTDSGVLDEDEVAELEATCQEALWDAAPHLLHPLYRLVGSWALIEDASRALSETTGLAIDTHASLDRLAPFGG